MRKTEIQELLNKKTIELNQALDNAELHEPTSIMCQKWKARADVLSAEVQELQKKYEEVTKNETK